MIASAKEPMPHSTHRPAPLSRMTCACSGWSLHTTGRPSAMYSISLVGEVEASTRLG